MQLPDPESLGVPEASATESHSDLSDVDEAGHKPEHSSDVAQRLVGVSISRTQTTVVSPLTPATERTEALWENRLAETLPKDETSDGPHEHEDAIDASEGAIRGKSPTSKLGPESPQPKATDAEQKEQSVHQRHPTESRTIDKKYGLSDINFKRFLGTLNLPSAPRAPNFKDFSFHGLSEFLGGNKDDSYNRSERKRSNTLVMNKAVWNRSPSPRSKLSPGRPPAGFKESNPDDAPKSSLRRSTSDQSLSIRRVTSGGSSFNDDSKWEHVQDQVNSRFKAVKDTWQDTNLMKMPKLPSMSFAGLRPEFLRNRASSDPLRLSPSNASELRSLQSSKKHNDRPWGPQTIDVPAVSSAASKVKAMHPKLTRALDELTGDLVILGGYRGSILRSAEPPHRQLWVPVKVGLNIRKVDLEVGLNPEDEEKMENHIIPGGMLSHIGPVDMGRRLLRKAHNCKNVQEGKLRIHVYSYDWRLSPHLLSRRLIDFVQKLPCNAEGVVAHERGAFIIAHSLGGLITRHAVNQQPHLFAGIVYAGVPHHCINILGPLRNDDKVLLSSKVLTAQVNFSFRTTFLLLPESGYCFIDKVTKESYPVNFFNVEDWKNFAFSPCIAPALPPDQTEKKSLLDTMTSNLPSVPASFKKVFSPEPTAPSSTTNTNPHQSNNLLTPATSPQLLAPTSTIPLPLAIDYLTRTLASTLQFKHELEFLPSLSRPHQNLYPPLATLYGTSVPTVSAARVASREAIKCCDAYDDLQFGSGDGVCLARAAMLPRGYEYVKGGRVKTEKGHVGLLGDLDGVGSCLIAVIKARREGVGKGESARRM